MVVLCGIEFNKKYFIIDGADDKKTDTSRR
jgi:hypothetical protein